MKFLDLVIHFLTQIWEVFSHYFLRMLSALSSNSFPSEPPIMWIFFFLMGSIIHVDVLHSFLFSDWIILNDLCLSSQIIYCAWLNFLLILYCIFHFIHCILNLQNLVIFHDFYFFVKFLVLFMFPKFIVYLCSLWSHWTSLK